MARSLLLAAVVLLIACCGPVPTKSQLNFATGEITTTEVGYAVPETGVVTHTAAVDTSQADTSLLGMILKTAGIVIASRLGQSVLTKSGRANFAVVADPDATWGATLAAVGHNTIGTSSPLEAVDRRIEREAPGPSEPAP